MALLSGNKNKQFEVTILQHLDAAYNLARWMTGNDADARDAVQSASVRALTYLDSLRVETVKPWFLGIVRNCCLDLLNERNGRIQDVDIEHLIDGQNELELLGANTTLPEHLLMNAQLKSIVNLALKQLPLAYREVLILREMEELSYEQIARMTDIPIGTVMSRLSRARVSLKRLVLALQEGKPS
jgi:RNA polymerase sigma-70 factor, ECF subfamily